MRLNAAQRHFYLHAGWSYDPQTQSSIQGRVANARALAKAEAWGEANGLRHEWSNDPDADRSGIEHDKPLWQLLTRNRNGQLVYSLGSVDFGSRGAPWGDPYQRVCEAEAAAEVMAEADAEKSIKTNRASAETRKVVSERRYLVAWSIDVWANSADEAARQALESIRRAGTIATVFQATPIDESTDLPAGPTETVDLGQA